MIGLIEVSEMSDADKDQLTKQVAAANAVLRVKAIEFGHPNIKALRKEFLKHSNHRRGKSILLFDQETRINLKKLVGLENIVLAVYVRIAKELADSFYLTNRFDRPHLDAEDYLQEATWVIFDCIYHYDGSTELCTYVYVSVKNRLIAYVRGEEVHAGIGRSVKFIRRKVRAIMRDRLVSVDEAINIFATDTPISSDTREMVRRSCYNVKCVGVDDECLDRAGESPNDSSESSLLHGAIANASLTEVQRELIESFMKTGERPDMDWVNNRINPNTGDPYTRQALSQQWVKACNKIRLLLPQFEEVAA